MAGSRWPSIPFPVPSLGLLAGTAREALLEARAELKAASAVREQLEERVRALANPITRAPGVGSTKPTGRVRRRAPFAQRDSDQLSETLICLQTWQERWGRGQHSVLQLLKGTPEARTDRPALPNQSGRLHFVMFGC
jgi:hypothetical protein